MTGPAPSPPRKGLERSLGLPSVIAISIGSMLGSGIFVLPGLAATQTGPSVWMAYLLAGICVIPAACCKAELATAMPTSGGTYVYLDRSRRAAHRRGRGHLAPPAHRRAG